MKLLWLAGAAAAAAGVALMANKRRVDTPLDFNRPPLVRKRERANGVHSRIINVLDWWEVNGPFPITIGGDGGLRTDEAKQLLLFREGRTKARTLAETPHGRGGAIDVYPTINGSIRGLEGDPNMQEAMEYFQIMADILKGRGLSWGGDWYSFKDRPHFELPDWRTLPMPGGGLYS